jgi:16S rRNA (cytosine967-C5)-methyltransferase
VRLGLDAACLQVLAGDAALPPQWWDTRPFDAILLDAPCSATGVLRRHPDAKWLKREADIAVLARTQATLLAALWPLLRPGGRLLYVTCSLLPEENAQILAAFSNTHPEAQAVQLALPHGQAYPPGWQLLPDTGAGDGFFYALLRKSL